MHAQLLGDLPGGQLRVGHQRPGDLESVAGRSPWTAEA
jgi:hypothetical protein